jgi:sodium-dependent dicarboxylate transporter 2/3/5
MLPIKKLFVLLFPPALGLLWTLLNPMTLTFEVNALGAMLFWMISWWLLEPVPMAITSLLPILFFPWLGLGKLEEVCAAYADKYVFLFLGGFFVALALEKTGLHRRVAYTVIRFTGHSYTRIVLGFMLSAYGISMWISNTATALMMFPMALSVCSLWEKAAGTNERLIRNAKICLFLGIAYASSIGGMATLVGTPPNAAASGIMSRTFGQTIGFSEWMAYGVPFSLGLLLLAYVIMTQLVFPIRTSKSTVEIAVSEWPKLEPMSASEKGTLYLLVLAVFLWLSESVIRWHWPAYPVTDVWTAIAVGMLFFILPVQDSKPILVWEDTTRLPWGILLMFGGGLALAFAFKESGCLDLLVNQLLKLNHLPVQIYLMLLCLMGLLLTAFMSNLAMVTLFVPVVGALALKLNMNPALFIIPVTLSASCDFMFPMSTPPNAIAFSSGYIKPAAMFRVGIILNGVSFLLLCFFVYLTL